MPTNFRTVGRWAIPVMALMGGGCAKHAAKLAPAPEFPESFPIPGLPGESVPARRAPVVLPDGSVPDDCVLLPDTPERLDTATIALPGPYDVAFAPTPRSDAERFAFRLLYDTLIRLDCRGVVHPALAQSWTRSPDGLTWTFKLRSEITGLDRKTLDAEGIARWWTADTARETRSRLAGISVVTAPDARTLAVRLTAPTDSVPVALADPAFAAGRAPPRHAVLALSQMLFDARDAIALGADVIVTDDREAIAYAGRADSFASLPLPWSRTVALVLPSGADSVAAAAADTPGFRESLARDGVRVDARPAERSRWGQLKCEAEPAVGEAAPRAGAARVAYPLGNRTAHDVAARLVALGLLGSRATAVALGPRDMKASLRAARERAYVVSLPAVSLVPCADRAPWPAGARVVPLVDTRYQVILSPRAPAFTVDWDGALRLAEPAVRAVERQ